MFERRNGNGNLRLLFLMLLILNCAFFLYWCFSPDSRTVAAQRIQELQINPGRIKLMGTASRGPGGQTPKAACLEWGPFAATDAAGAEAALAGLAMKYSPLQRTVGEAGGVKRVAYFVREPDPALVGRIADLQRSFPETSIKAGPCPS
jgi:hypothetical protein